MSEHVFKFEPNFENNNGYNAERIGVITLGDGSLIRLVFTMGGLKAVISKHSKSIIYVEDIPYKGLIAKDLT